MRRNRDASKVSVKFSPGPIGTVPTYFRNHTTSKSDSLLLLQMAFGGKFCVSPWLSRYVVVMQEHLQRALCPFAVWEGVKKRFFFGRSFPNVGGWGG